MLIRGEWWPYIPLRKPAHVQRSYTNKAECCQYHSEVDNHRRRAGESLAQRFYSIDLTAGHSSKGVCRRFLEYNVESYTARLRIHLRVETLQNLSMLLYERIDDHHLLLGITCFVAETPSCKPGLHAANPIYTTFHHAPFSCRSISTSGTPLVSVVFWGIAADPLT